MKLILLTVCLSFCALPLSHAADIFTPPPPQTDPKAAYQNFQTSKAFLKATRSGEIPELIKSLGYETQSMDGDVGVPVVAILRNEYRASDPKGALPHYEWNCKKAITFLTQYELEGGKNEKLASAFQEAREHLSHGEAGPGFKESFDSFAKDYSRTLKEYIVSKKEREEQQIAAETEARRQAEMATQKAQEERRQAMAATNAKAASIRAEEDTRAAAVREAMAAQEKIRALKLQEVLASPAYKIWQASLQVEEGQRMVKTAQRVLEHDDAVQRESGVVDLSARRAAGEQVVAGKRLVEQAFVNYKQLGGTARTPDDVRAGPDPAQEHR
jgi:hypothetical protein